MIWPLQRCCRNRNRASRCPISLATQPVTTPCSLPASGRVFLALIDDAEQQSLVLCSAAVVRAVRLKVVGITVMSRRPRPRFLSWIKTQRLANLKVAISTASTSCSARAAHLPLATNAIESSARTVRWLPIWAPRAVLHHRVRALLGITAPLSDGGAKQTDRGARIELH